MRVARFLALVCALSGAAGCRAPAPAPTAADARTFLETVNETVTRLGIQSNRASWVQQTFITDDSDALSARASQEIIAAIARFAKEAARFDGVELPSDQRRQIDLLKLSLVVVTPSNTAEAEELTQTLTRMQAAYGKGKWCRDPARPDSCLNVDGVTKVMAASHDERALREVWEGWHSIGPPIKRDYARFVELSNKGARELGFADTGAMWRAKYDMPPADFARELDRLWDQVRPLYLKLHTYVRMKLREHYGEAVPAAGPIPAHLLGNIWAQDWSNIGPLVSPAGGGPGYSLNDILRRRNLSPIEMVRTGERFYTSLGFEALPPTFWERSLFVRPRDREVVCHASAWNIDLEADLRIKMCITQTAEDFTTIHHELGHNFYSRAYHGQPVLFRDSANDGFHEAIGDTIALSVTPEYLVRIGLLTSAPDASRDTGELLSRALKSIAFLPFGLLIDQWRWKVFAGEVIPDHYNAAWWDLRLKYQGVAPPSGAARTSSDFFDPGAKYHVPDNTPYSRYFLASILQFQFHRALAQAAGCTGPLHRCSIYENAEAGSRLKAMLSLGLSRPWPEALEAIARSRQMDATAILDYFAPLSAWLDDQTRGQPQGW